jgi:hypothetical protein
MGKMSNGTLNASIEVQSRAHRALLEAGTATGTNAVGGRACSRLCRRTQIVQEEMTCL